MEEKKQERPTLPFGKEVRVGNYKVLKFTKSLTKEQLKRLRLGGETAEHGLREASGLREKGLSRAGIPYIKVEAISGVFGLTLCCNTQVFYWLDYCIPVAVEAEENGVKLEENSLADILHVFDMWMTDVCVTGDEQYYVDKGLALRGLIDRMKAVADATGTVAAGESAEEKAKDDKVLEEVKADEEQKAVLMEMASSAGKPQSTDEGGGV